MISKISLVFMNKISPTITSWKHSIANSNTSMALLATSTPHQSKVMTNSEKNATLQTIKDNVCIVI